MTSFPLAAAAALFAIFTPAKLFAEDIKGLLSFPGVLLETSGPETQDRVAGVRMRAGSIGLSLETLSRAPAPGALRAGQATGGDAAFPDLEDPASGRIRFAAASVSDLRAIPLLLSRAICDDPSPGVVTPVKIALRDVSLRASRHMLAQDQAPERIDIPELEVSVKMDASARCLVFEEISVRSVTAYGIDGASLYLAELRILLRKGSFGALAEMDLRGLRVMDASRDELMALGLLRVRAKLDRDPDALLSELGLISDPAARLIRMAETSDPEVEVSLRGLYLPLGRLLPEAERKLMGLDETAKIQGEGTVAFSAPGNDINLSGAVNMSGLLRLLLELDLQASETGAPPAVAPPGLEKFSLLLPLMPFEIRSAHLSLQDLGARQMIESATGASLEDKVVGALAPLGPLASEIDDPLRQWLRDAFFDGASLDLAPAAPVGLLRVGLQAFMDSSGLEDILGLRTGAAEF